MVIQGTSTEFSGMGSISIILQQKENNELMKINE